MEPPVLHFFSMASGEAGTAAGRLTGNGTLAQPPPSLVTSKEWVLDGWVDVQPASLPQK